MRSHVLLILATLCLLLSTAGAASSSTVNSPVRELSTEFVSNEQRRLRGDNNNKLVTDGFNANDEERTISTTLARMKNEISGSMKKFWASIVERLYKVWRKKSRVQNTAVAVGT
ncbi:hypothetical protein F441_00380 [Phytophthora nicotianae CJ01A1]|uniref:RxLR effector protein n=6 Tax=Phytophthora nicotianae TaxID=4792 RepID=W2RGQ0_PHYN3|nr:hypothetical protein PPTG_20708 [Phytophthora nicotianae INRA-310]ETI57290.1 hypothetical protein F443_00398 [Phytophthora nicotianae P1569]ETK97055.1 hypothetical protein L915_00355 [Phytophthora nicotianae]ETO86035.1 hypothetical protein F444_00382 [Phytophthora nicotianae P1976]ETP27071.1 hypothetical protein F441_00380 [Phytophthora nicotianae CJ01A1]ETP55028.1 hypothetical protein F442_00376 [Phytophthora nicotianae P10297]KUF78264.1 hypothetical protein AM587_10008114 [Phytophthora n